MTQLDLMEHATRLLTQTRDLLAQEQDWRNKATAFLRQEFEAANTRRLQLKEDLVDIACRGSLEYQLLYARCRAILEIIDPDQVMLLDGFENLPPITAFTPTTTDKKGKT